MDIQNLFNIAIAIAGFLGGWVLNNISKTIVRLDEDVREMPLMYVTKDDYRADITEIKGMLAEIYKELRATAHRDWTLIPYLMSNLAMLTHWGTFCL